MPLSNTIKDKVDIVHTLLSIIALLIGGTWGMNEYLDKKNQDRINKSYEVVARFKENGDVRKYEEFVESPEIDKLLHDQSLSGTKKSDKLAALHTDIVLKNLRRTIGQFEDAVVCVNAKLCDRDVIAAFLGEAASNTFVYSYTNIKNDRKNNMDARYAEELEIVRGWYCILPVSSQYKRKKHSWCKYAT